jgi:DNA modification methylase
MRRELHFGDNLEVLRDTKLFPDECVDLIYLDPPFNSNASYNMLFKDKKGERSDASITAFDDTWHWGITAEEAFDDVVRGNNLRVSQLLKSIRSFLGDNDLMAYLAMMSIRLVELRRVLKDTGSLFLHCDPTASHYLKLVLDAVFGPENFLNEIIWQRSTGKSHSYRRFPTNHDVILSVSKTSQATWNKEAMYVPYDPLNLPDKTATKYSRKDADGRTFRLDNLINPNSNRPNLTYEFLGVTRVWRWTKSRMEKAYKDGLVVQAAPGKVPQLVRYLDEQEGIPISDVWTDIPPLNSQAKERLGYPTQKPLALLERIIKAASKPGDLVLDPFCGCGTAVDAAEKLGRNWIGIDITHLAIDLIERRIKDRYPKLRGKDAFNVLGLPQDFDSAEKLAQSRPDQFEKWSVTRITGARPYKIKGADAGIDGILEFKQDLRTYRRVIFSVKGGKNLGVAMIRDLKGVMDREQDCAMAVFICLHQPTQPMRVEAANSGFHEWGGKRFQRLQILTIRDYFEGRLPILPGSIDPTASYRVAPQHEETSNQGDLDV